MSFACVLPARSLFVRARRSQAPLLLTRSRSLELAVGCGMLAPLVVASQQAERARFGGEVPPRWPRANPEASSVA